MYNNLKKIFIKTWKIHLKSIEADMTLVYQLTSTLF